MTTARSQLPPELAAALAANPALAARNPGLIDQWPAPPPADDAKEKPKRGTPEDDFQQQIIDLAHLNGWRVAHFRNVRVQRADGSVYYEVPVQEDGKGFLDLVLARERIIWIEVKAGQNKPSKEQQGWIDALKAAGQEVYVFWPSDWPEIEKVLK